MRKKIILVLTSVLLGALSVFGLTACSPAKNVTVQFIVGYDVNGNEVPYYYTGKAGQQIPSYEEMKAEFESELMMKGYEFSSWDNGFSGVLPNEDSVIRANFTVTTTPDSAFTFNSGVITGLTEEGKEYNAIKVPSSINGVTVTEIGSGAFNYDYIYLNEIVLPEGLLKIGGGAFKHRIRKVNIPSTVTHIGASAFDTVLELTGMLPQGIVSIGDWAFNGCEGFTEVNIPATCEYVGDDAFIYCHQIATFNVDANNPAYKSVDGVLYSKDGKTLIKYPAKKQNKNFDMPNDVVTVKNNAFMTVSALESVMIGKSVYNMTGRAFINCSSMKNFTVHSGNYYFQADTDGILYLVDNMEDKNVLVKWPTLCSASVNYLSSGLTEIGEYAFERCKIETFEIYPSITKIGAYAFGYCSALKTIRYKGTTQEWQAVNKKSTWAVGVGATYVECTNGNVNVK